MKKTFYTPLRQIFAWSLPLTALLLLHACGDSAAERRIRETAEQLDSVANYLAKAQSSPTLEQAEVLMQHFKVVDFAPHNDDAKMDDDERAEWESLKQRHQQQHSQIQSLLAEKPIRVYAKSGLLADSATIVPIFLQAGELLTFNVESEQPVNVYVYNNDSQQTVYQKRKTTFVSDTYTVRFDAVYVVVVQPHGRQYANIQVSMRTQQVERFAMPHPLTSVSENCGANDPLAREITGIRMDKAFEEPRKLTLRGHLHSVFSGNYRALVPIQVTKGATDVLYNLQISTNESAPSDENEFYDGMSTSYKEVRIMGLPLYETRSGSGLLSTLLGMNTPVREEDAYINMYVFYDAKQARKFQNGTSVDKLKYNLDYSTIGTQSCNGRIPTKGRTTVYLGFENERMRYNNYVWLSALLIRPHKEYIKPVFKLATASPSTEEEEP